MTFGRVRLGTIFNRGGVNVKCTLYTLNNSKPIKRKFAVKERLGGDT